MTRSTDPSRANASPLPGLGWSTGRSIGWSPRRATPAPTATRRSPRSPAASARSASPIRSWSARTATSSPATAGSPPRGCLGSTEVPVIVARRV